MVIASTFFMAIPCAALAQPPAEGPAASDADKDEAARKLFELGNNRYKEGRYVEAIEAFEEAYRLSERPELLFNLANANERMGNLKAAIRHLEAYRESAPEDEIQMVDRRLEGLRERAGTNEKPIEPTPDPSPTGGPTPVPGPTPDPFVPSDPNDEDEGTSAATATGAVLLAVGGAGLIVGVVGGSLALSARSEADDNCAAGLCNAEGTDANDRDGSLSLGADLTLVFGGALAVGGIIALIVGAVQTDDDEADSAWVSMPVVNGAGLKWQTRF